MATTVRSHAKINLGLGIGAPRADGFHGLVTLYQTLELYDRVTVTAKRAKATAIRISSNERRVPVDARNTAWKMIELVVAALNLAAEIHVHIEKKLPIQGGLGAGSANAVAALVGLEAELGLSAEATPHWKAERLQLAAQVGSDVPLFLIGGTVLGLDRGQLVFPMPNLTETWCVVAIPGVGVSTPKAFRDWDERLAGSAELGGLTGAASEARLSELSRVYAASLTGADVWDGSSGVSALGGDLAGPQVSALVRTGIANDFEQVVFLQHPLLSEIKRTLAATGHPGGSPSCVIVWIRFGTFWALPRPGRCRSSPAPIACDGSAELVDSHPARAQPTGGRCF